MREEFQHLELGSDQIEKNVRICREVFGALPALEIQPQETIVSGAVRHVDYSDPLRGTPSVLSAGNAEQRHTGAWRVERPVIDRDACTRCGLCFVLCPDGAISLDRRRLPR